MIFSYYIKKEDARKAVDYQKMVNAIVLITLAIVLEIVQLYIYPQIVDIFVSFDQAMPTASVIANYFTHIVAIAAIVSGVYFLVSKPDYSKADAVAGKYKAGEMIRTSEIINLNVMWIILIMFIFVMAYLTSSVILPIYDLTNSL